MCSGVQRQNSNPVVACIKIVMSLVKLLTHLQLQLILCYVKVEWNGDDTTR